MKQQLLNRRVFLEIYADPATNTEVEEWMVECLLTVIPEHPIVLGTIKLQVPLSDNQQAFYLDWLQDMKDAAHYICIRRKFFEEVEECDRP